MKARETDVNLETFYPNIRSMEDLVATPEFAAMNPPHRLVVIDAPVEKSVIVVSETTSRILEVPVGDAVLIKTEYDKATAVIVEVDPEISDGSVGMNYIDRENILVQIGDSAIVEKIEQIQSAEKVLINPMKDTLGDFSGSIWDDLLQPYFIKRERLLVNGDRFLCHDPTSDSTSTVEFKVLDVAPSGIVRVEPRTVIFYEGGTRRHQSERKLMHIRRGGDLLHTLAPEILLLAFDELPISTCLLLRQPRHCGALHDFNKTRFSASTYLKQHLNCGEELLQAMAESDMHLLGLGALGLFSPEHVKQIPSWCFVAPWGRRRRQHFMKFMERNGVVWDNGIETFWKRLLRGQNTTVSKRFVNRACYLTSPFDEIKSEFNKTSHQWVLLEWTTDGFHWSYRTDRPNNVRKWEILHGQLVGGHRIEMLYSNDRETDYRDLLLQLPLSALQCSINGYGAIHMYGNATAAGICYRWRQNNRPEVDIECSLVRSEDLLQGMEFRVCHEPRTREIFDADATVIEAEKPATWSSENWGTAMRQSCQIIWTQELRRTNLLKTSRGFVASGPDARTYHLFRSRLLPEEVDEDYLLEHGLM